MAELPVVKRLRKEMESLKRELTVDLPKELERARAHGDLSENAEYHAAREKQGFIIRRDPTGSLLETDRDVEFRIYQSMAKAGVPVPPVYWIEPDGGVLERPFFVMGRVPGQATPGVLAGPAYPGSK